MPVCGFRCPSLEFFSAPLRVTLPFCRFLTHLWVSPSPTSWISRHPLRGLFVLSVGRSTPRGSHLVVFVLGLKLRFLVLLFCCCCDVVVCCWCCRGCCRRCLLPVVVLDTTFCIPYNLSPRSQ